jgi:hypothetical protein
MKACDYLNHVFPTSGPPNIFDGHFDPMVLFVFYPMFVFGFFLSVLVCFWILLKAMIYIVLDLLQSNHANPDFRLAIRRVSPILHPA